MHVSLAQIVVNTARELNIFIAILADSIQVIFKIVFITFEIATLYWVQYNNQ